MIVQPIVGQRYWWPHLHQVLEIVVEQVFSHPRDGLIVRFPVPHDLCATMQPNGTHINVSHRHIFNTQSEALQTALDHTRQALRNHETDGVILRVRLQDLEQLESELGTT